MGTVCEKINALKCMHGYIMTLGQGLQALQGPCSKGVQISCFVPRCTIPKQWYFCFENNFSFSFYSVL